MAEYVARAIARPPDTDVEFKLTPLSFVRMFGSESSTAIPANQWTPIKLDPNVVPWREEGEKCWEWIPSDDPDHAISAAGVRCLQEGVYSFSGNVVFDSAQQPGDRALNISEVKGLYTGKWRLAVSQPMPKVADGGLLVSGTAYHYVGDIIEMQAYSTVNTGTDGNALTEWMAITLINVA